MIRAGIKIVWSYWRRRGANRIKHPKSIKIPESETPIGVDVHTFRSHVDGNGSIFDLISKGFRVDELKGRENLTDSEPLDAEYEYFHRSKHITAIPTVQKQVITFAVNNPQAEFNNLVKDVDISIKDLTKLGIVMCSRGIASWIIGIKLLRYTDSKGDDHGRFELAVRLNQGTAEEKKEAMARLEKLAVNGHLKAQGALGSLLLNESPKAAVELLRQAAGKNDVLSCLTLGQIFMSGNKVPVNHHLAENFLASAHKEGCVEATFLLSVLYMDKKSDKFNFKNSFNLCLEAANKGLAVAQHNAATLFFDPHIESSDHNLSLWKAVEYYKMAAIQGFYQSQVNLAKIYMKGYEIGSEKIVPNLEEAKQWLTAAENQVGGRQYDIIVLKEEYREQMKIQQLRDHERCIVM